jgi:hypothetical protein
LTEHLARWVSPSFGVKFSSGSSATEVGDIVSTFHSYWGGDAKAWQGTATEGTYTAAGLSAGIPAIVAPDASTAYAPGFGRFNHIRQKQALTLGIVANCVGTQYDASLLYYGAEPWNSIRINRNRTGSLITASVVNGGYQVSFPQPADDFVAMAAGNQGGDVWISIDGNARVTATGAIPGRLFSGERSDQNSRGPAWGIGAYVRRAGDTTDTLEPLGLAEGQFGWSDAFGFSVEVTPTQEAALNTFLQGRLGR